MDSDQQGQGQQHTEPRSNFVEENQGKVKFLFGRCLSTSGDSMTLLASLLSVHPLISLRANHTEPAIEYFFLLPNVMQSKDHHVPSSYS
jgi:hypothetical protein